MKISSLAIAFCFVIQSAFSQNTQNESYQFSVNLKKVHNKTLTVDLITPKINSDNVNYRFPAMVPGTYAIYDFGRFVINFHAYDAAGAELKFTKPDINSWTIDGAKNLFKISYDVQPTFVSELDNPVFEPVGTNIQQDTNYVINNHGFFGYFDGYINNTYNLSFTKPQGFYGATSLNATERTNDMESFTSDGYGKLVDNPIMFTKTDTASVLFDEADIMISVYSPGKGMNAPDIAATLKPLLTAIRTYLGGKLPTDRYTFIFYFADKPGVSGANGALEHNQSSLYYMPDVPSSYKDYMLKQLTSTCAHEFMHIVTPLNLHSEEIGNFDFNNPVMSEHLWLYEGTTEYSAYYIQLRQGMISLKDYVDDLNKKFKGAARFNDTLPFTEMSKGALDTYKRQYENVYEKGALIGFCLDVLIRKESGGQQGFKEVEMKLLDKYGMKKSFKDEDLFNDFIELTSPKIGEFFSRYVTGSEKLPYQEVCDIIGLSFQNTPYQSIDFGTIRIGFNRETFRLKITEIDENNELQKSLGVRKDDELVSLNGTKINFQNIMEIFGSAKKPAKEGDDFVLEVARTGDNGKENTVKLTAKVTKTKTSYDGKFTINENPTEQQLSMRNAWLGK